MPYPWKGRRYNWAENWCARCDRLGEDDAGNPILGDLCDGCRCELAANERNLA